MLPSVSISIEATTHNDLNPDAYTWQDAFQQALGSRKAVRLLVNPSLGAASITGLIAAPGGTMLYLRNPQPIGGNSVTFENLNSGSQSANQFSLPASTFVLAPQQCAIAVYDSGNWTIAS